MKYLIIATFLSVAARCTEIKGVGDSELLSLIKSQISNWKDFSSEAIANKFRLEKDEEIIKKLADSFGYFDSEVTSRIKNNKAVFTVKLNKRYRFNDVSLVYTDQKDYRSGIKVGQVFDLINIAYNSYTDSKQISDGKEKIEDFLKKQGFAFVKINKPIIEFDIKNKNIKVTYSVTLSGKTIIDKTMLNIKTKKDPKLIESFIKNRIPWKDGDIYDLQKVEDLKDKLMTSGIFSTIDVTLSPPVPDPKDPEICHTVVNINIEEGKLREIAAGGRYGSSEKFGILLSWTHYNIDGKGSKFSTVADLSKITKNIKLKYDVYDLFYKEQDLANKIFYKKENVDAYNVSAIGAESILWQNFGKSFKAGAGICCENSKTKDKYEDSKIENKTEDKLKKVKFKAVGIPIGVNFDTTDNYLDPQKGIRCSCMATPYIGKPSNITIITGKAAVYLPIRKNAFKNTLIISFYTKMGSILRNKKHTMPRDKFFFAGGNNSVRGYEYQMLGEVNDKKKPCGGESLFEIGIEPRLRISDDIGVVAFLEGGNVYSSNTPKPLKKLLFGYGVGGRYYTPLGPIRLDVAFPTKLRKTKSGKRIDSRFILYISVGQAF